MTADRAETGSAVALLVEELIDAVQAGADAEGLIAANAGQVEDLLSQARARLDAWRYGTRRP